MIWKTLGRVSPRALVDARLQAHHAARVVASAGTTFLEPQPDDSHPNFGWDDSSGALLGRSLPGIDSQVGLRLADLSLILMEGSGRVTREFALDGRTLDEAYDWLASATAAARPRVGTTLTRSTYALPGHPVEKGGRFSASPRETFEELSRWFANGFRALGELACETPGASEVRCWPHHFDVGALVVVATAPDGSVAKSVGVGLSPGDESYAEPYWYVSPWPYPDPSGLPPLPNGSTWHTDGFTSAIFRGTAFTEALSDRQDEQARSFLCSAVDASRRILEEDPA